MKSPRCHYSGFTLVELLVVIAIIAILAAVLTVAAGSVINQAKRAKAQNSATQIQTGITNYYTEYGLYPLPTSYNGSSSGDLLEKDATTEKDLFYALCGNINAYSPQTPNNTGSVSNARNIPFLTPKKSEVDTNGVVVTAFSSASGPYYYFSIAMDADYSGILGDTGSVTGAMPDFTNWKANNSIKYLSSGITQGSAIWACCDPNYLTNTSGSQTPAYWVHTY
jgi:prepilin-type N-terminal cleavage/methylation domain-containing protein